MVWCVTRCWQLEEEVYEQVMAVIKETGFEGFDNTGAIKVGGEGPRSSPRAVWRGSSRGVLDTENRVGGVEVVS